MAEAILVALGLAAAELTGGETSEGRRESASARLDCDPNRLVLARFRLLPDDDEDESDESDRCSRRRRAPLQLPRRGRISPAVR